MDKLAGMQVFVKAVECGSFTAAGEALSMSSQLVGKHVAALRMLQALQTEGASGCIPRGGQLFLRKNNKSEKYFTDQ